MQATRTHSLHPAQFLLTLFALMAAFCALTAARPAQAQSLSLARKDITVNLHYSDGSTKTGKMSFLSQSSDGSFSGSLKVIGGFTYNVTGKLSYYGIWLGAPTYQFIFDANYLSLSRTYSETIHCNGWIAEDYPNALNDTFDIKWGNFNWNSYSVFNGSASGTGTFDGWGMATIL